MLTGPIVASPPCQLTDAEIKLSQHSFPKITVLQNLNFMVQTLSTKTTTISIQQINMKPQFFQKEWGKKKIQGP